MLFTSGSDRLLIIHVASPITTEVILQELFCPLLLERRLRICGSLMLLPPYAFVTWAVSSLSTSSPLFSPWSSKTMFVPLFGKTEIICLFVVSGKRLIFLIHDFKWFIKECRNVYLGHFSTKVYH